MGFCYNSAHRHGVYYDEKVSQRLKESLVFGETWHAILHLLPKHTYSRCNDIASLFRHIQEFWMSQEL